MNNTEEKIAKLDAVKQQKPKKKKPKAKPVSKKPAASAPSKATGSTKAPGGNKKHTVKKSAPKKKTRTPEKIRKQQSHGKTAKNKDLPLRIIPLGGLDEIGKNITAIEYGDDIIIIDCGMAFPDADMLGIDLVIPDFTYLFKNRTKIRGIFVTHGHEDHIGSLPYFLKEINVPVYANRLTIGLIRRKLAEHKLDKQAILMECKPGDTVKRGCFNIEFIKVNHSIADSAAFAIGTPVGKIIHTGDFKIDTTPIRGRMIDLTRLGTLGKEGVLLLMSDSTNAERPGMALSERLVGVSLENIFAKALEKRIFIATFSSNVHRVQQIIKTAVKYGRKVAISGRSMESVISVAHELGYIDIPKGTIVPIEKASNFPKSEIVIITTGSQGEPMSALYRMAFSDHRTIAIDKEDLVVISATPIPGNEKLVSTVVNELEKLGAEVISDRSAGVHVSGHACQEELKLILGLIKPKFFMPVHGEYRHLLAHKRLAIDSGMDEKDVFINEVGGVLEIYGDRARIAETVQSGQIMIDGGGVGDVGNIVMRDRHALAEDGMVVAVAAVSAAQKRIVSGPDIISRGFVYMRDSEELINGAKEAVTLALTRNIQREVFDWSTLKNDAYESLRKYILSKTKRTPVIIPIIIEV